MPSLHQSEPTTPSKRRGGRLLGPRGRIPSSARHPGGMGSDLLRHEGLFVGIQQARGMLLEEHEKHDPGDGHRPRGGGSWHRQPNAASGQEGSGRTKKAGHPGPTTDQGIVERWDTMQNTLTLSPHRACRTALTTAERGGPPREGPWTHGDGQLPASLPQIQTWTGRLAGLFGGAGCSRYVGRWNAGRECGRDSSKSKGFGHAL